MTYNFDSNAVLILELLKQKEKFESLFELKLSDIEGEFGRRTGSWKPSEEWFTENKSRLPLKSILDVIKIITAKREEAYLLYDATDEEIIRLIRKTSMIGLQEDTLKFAFYEYFPSSDIQKWISEYFWRTVYDKNMQVPLFIGKKIRYFNAIGPISKEPFEEIVKKEELKE